jgi:NADH dehydrogenase [ubiquinone] 1 alpha subcomplex assembly factor 7
MKERLRSRGPMTVAAYMEACNNHYYATRDPLGVAGDFTTAPEISQMFGEMVGAALADCWIRAGKPEDAVYVELGPGRGTLAADALRVMRGAGFSGAVHFVETSERLRDEQARRVPNAVWHGSIAGLPPAPLLLVANEFFDALPVEQWVGDEERLVTLDGERLTFVQQGLVQERSPARSASATAIARHFVTHGGAALVIDYGHGATAPGDTLQAVKAHGFADPLADPGEQDLTAHVDFAAVRHAAEREGAAVAGPVEQGAFLRATGIGQRTEALAHANPERADKLATALHRLTDSAAMGSLFKVIAIHHPDWPVPAGFAP